MEATIEIMGYKSGKKIDRELRHMLNSYLSAIGLLEGSHDGLYANPYYAINALRRELSSVSQSKELTDELKNAIKLLRDEDFTQLPE
ncbi:MAG: hypothetical protein ACR2IJ_07505 [Fluviibacter sp.]